MPKTLKRRIVASDVYKEYPSAVIDPHYVVQLGDRFEATVLMERA